jgi:hypothetical protein
MRHARLENGLLCTSFASYRIVTETLIIVHPFRITLGGGRAWILQFVEGDSKQANGAGISKSSDSLLRRLVGRHLCPWLSVGVVAG